MTPYNLLRVLWWICAGLMAVAGVAEAVLLWRFGWAAPETPGRLFQVALGVGLVGVFLWLLRHDRPGR